MKLSEYARKNSITYHTAFLYWKRGLLRGRYLPTGTIVIDEDVNNTRDYSIYCRVSSHDQKQDLERQEQRLRDYCSAKGFKVVNIYSEIASGLNDDRPKFNKILLSDTHIVVEHRDRLTRFGFNFIASLLRKSNREIVVINEVEDKHDLIQDFVSVITSFCARIYGQRRSKRKTEKLIKELQDEDNP